MTPGGGGTPTPSFDPPDIIESSISMKIEILMLSMRYVFLTPEVCSFDPGGGGAFHPLPPTITRPTLNTRNESLMFSIRSVLLTLRTDKQTSKQTIFFSKTLLYEKENKISQQFTQRFTDAASIHVKNMTKTFRAWKLTYYHLSLTGHIYRTPKIESNIRCDFQTEKYFSRKKYTDESISLVLL